MKTFQHSPEMQTLIDKGAPVPEDNDLTDDGVRLNAAFQRIPDRSVRQSIIIIAETCAGKSMAE